MSACENHQQSNDVDEADDHSSAYLVRPVSRRYQGMRPMWFWRITPSCVVTFRKLGMSDIYHLIPEGNDLQRPTHLAREKHRTVSRSTGLG
jgi:hypothetical protein